MRADQSETTSQASTDAAGDVAAPVVAPVAAPVAARGEKRRSGSETRKKSIPVTSRYDEAEFAELEEAASRAGLSRASYQRVQSLAKPKTRSTRRPSIERELAAQLLGQMGRVGGNLHRLVRHLNFGKEAEARQVAEVIGALELLKQEIMQELGRRAAVRKAG